MQITLQRVEEILRQSDIEGYIGDGAPNDEYAAEAEILFQVIQRLDENEINPENLILITSEIWRTSFDLGAEGMSARTGNIQNFVNMLLNTQ